jgi:hypothetical protein
MIIASVADVVIISVLALRRIEMQAISVAVAAAVLAAAALFGFRGLHQGADVSAIRGFLSMYEIQLMLSRFH